MTPLVSQLASGILLLIFVFSFAAVSAPNASAASTCSNNASCRTSTAGREPVCKNPGKSTSKCVQCVRNSDCRTGYTCDTKQDICVDKNGGTYTNEGVDKGTGKKGGFTKAVDNLSCKSSRGEPGVKVESLGGYCVPKDPAGFAREYYSIGLGLIGGLSLLFIMFGGYILLTSQGNPVRLQNGKTFIFYALFGLLLAIFGYIFIEVIAIDILRIPGFER